MSFVARRRLLLAAIAAAALGGLALGLVLGRGSGSALAQGRPGVVAQGKFVSVAWGTTGTATIVRNTSGRLELRLSKSFSTQRAPELFVYLARHDRGRRTEWKELGSLRSAWGAQRYLLPADAADVRGLSVAIVCEKCNKTWGAARFAAEGRSAA
jgi:hypothetical protein